MNITLKIEHIGSMGDFVSVFVNGEMVKFNEHFSKTQTHLFYINFYQKWAFRTYKQQNVNVELEIV